MGCRIIAGGIGTVRASPLHRTDGALQGGEMSTSILRGANLGLPEIHGSVFMKRFANGLLSSTDFAVLQSLTPIPLHEQDEACAYRPSASAQRPVLMPGRAGRKELVANERQRNVSAEAHLRGRIRCNNFLSAFVSSRAYCAERPNNNLA